MDRRAFLGRIVGGVATAAAVRTWPFRVFSFPSEVKPWFVANWGFDEPNAYYCTGEQAEAWNAVMADFLSRENQELRFYDLLKSRCAVPISLRPGMRIPMRFTQGISRSIVGLDGHDVGKNVQA